MTKTMEKNCSECGTIVVLEAPDIQSKMIAALGVTCAACSEKQRVIEAAEVRQEAEYQRWQRVKKSGIPEVLSEVSFDDLEKTDQNREAARIAWQWGQGRVNGVLLSGPVGVGKTWLAAAAANLYLQEKSLRWFSVARLMAQARAGFKTKAREDITDLMTNPKLALVLDDIDKAKPTDFARDILFELIDERINNRASLLITTNMNSGEFAEAYGEAIASRVAGYCEAKRIDGDDRRQSR